jgi:predicted transcriptional regulator
MTLGQIMEALDAEFLCGERGVKREIDTVCACDLMSDVLAIARPGSLLLTGLVNPQVVRTAEMVELSAVCFVRGKRVEAETISLARNKGLPLIRTRLSMFKSCGELCERGLAGPPEASGSRLKMDGAPYGRESGAGGAGRKLPGKAAPATGKGNQ